jgi:polysaccharide pyruvyl transferase WcaK-like protein
VYGWYHQQNIGDDLFIQAFHKIFPELTFIFTNRITVSDLADVSSVFFGGGSFVYDVPNMEPAALDLLKQKNIFYIGVGIEGSISSVHQDLMKIAKVIAIRSPNFLQKVSELNPNTMVIPDIVYSLYEKSAVTKKKNSVLIIPNIIVVPHHADPHWKHAAWGYFKSEFCQFLDELMSKGHKVDFLSMCNNNIVNDLGAAIEIVNHMKNRKYNSILPVQSEQINNLINLFAQYEVIITQRYHGIVLAQLARVPYLSIHHHDKLKNASIQEGGYLSYYGLNKQELFSQFNCMKDKKLNDFQLSKLNVFEELHDKVLAHI